MKLNAKVRGRVPKPVMDGEIDLDYIASSVANMVQDENVAQIPVNKGDLRRSVSKRKAGRYRYIVGPTLRRAVYLHEGTGRWAGSSYDFGRRNGGRTREARYTEDEIAMFKAIAKRGGKISIPPDKFADRTVEVITPQAVARAKRLTRDMFNQQRNI